MKIEKVTSLEDEQNNSLFWQFDQHNNSVLLRRYFMLYNIPAKIHLLFFNYDWRFKRQIESKVFTRKIKHWLLLCFCYSHSKRPHSDQLSVATENWTLPCDTRGWRQEDGVLPVAIRNGRENKHRSSRDFSWVIKSYRLASVMVRKLSYYYKSFF